MPQVVFAPVLQRHVTCPPLDVTGATVREAVEAACTVYPGVRAYVLDDQSALRKHMIIFVDGTAVIDRRNLSDAVSPSSRIYVMQSLSGG